MKYPLINIIKCLHFFDLTHLRDIPFKRLGQNSKINSKKVENDSINNKRVSSFFREVSIDIGHCHLLRDHPFKTSACLRGEGVKNLSNLPTHSTKKLLTVGGQGSKICENLPTS